MQRRRARSQYCKGELIEREDFSEDLAAFKFRTDKQLAVYTRAIRYDRFSGW